MSIITTHRSTLASETLSQVGRFTDAQLVGIAQSNYSTIYVSYVNPDNPSVLGYNGNSFERALISPTYIPIPYKIQGCFSTTGDHLVYRAENVRDTASTIIDSVSFRNLETGSTAVTNKTAPPGGTGFSSGFRDLFVFKANSGVVRVFILANNSLFMLNSGLGLVNTKGSIGDSSGSSKKLFCANNIAYILSNGLLRVYDVTTPGTLSSVILLTEPPDSVLASRTSANCKGFTGVVDSLGNGYIFLLSWDGVNNSNATIYIRKAYNPTDIFPNSSILGQFSFQIPTDINDIEFSVFNYSSPHEPPTGNSTFDVLVTYKKAVSTGEGTAYYCHMIGYRINMSTSTYTYYGTADLGQTSNSNLYKCSPGYETVVSGVTDAGAPELRFYTYTFIIPVAITTQPSSQSINQGNPVTFSVVVSGDTPITYQWKKNGVNISGATSSSYNIPSVISSDAGNYSVTVTNSANSVTSNNASLTVIVPISIITQPISSTLIAGQNAIFTVEVSGTSPVYQWKKNGINISGTNSPTLNINNVTDSDSGTYTVSISNSINSVTSNNAILTVNTPISITTQPISVSSNIGGNATFTVIVNGTNPQYQWRKDGINIPGEVASTLNISNITIDDISNYDCIISNVVNSVTSNTVNLYLDSPPIIETQPESHTLNPGDSVVFSVLVSGSTPLSYQWKKNNIDISGETSDNLSLTNLQELDEGEYTVFISNIYGDALSDPATLLINTPIEIITQPEPQIANIGDLVAITINANGTEPITYQWRKNGIEILDETSDILYIQNAQISDSGYYDVIISNVVGDVFSDSIYVSVGDPVGYLEPITQDAYLNQIVTIQAFTEGTEPITYQWRKNGIEILGETSDTLNILITNETDAGEFDCVITNPIKSIISNLSFIIFKTRTNIIETTLPGIGRVKLIDFDLYPREEAEENRLYYIYVDQSNNIFISLKYVPSENSTSTLGSDSIIS